MHARWEDAIKRNDAQALHSLLAQGTNIDAGADLSLRGSGAPGFAGKTAYDLAVERGMQDLTKILTPKPDPARP